MQFSAILDNFFSSFSLDMSQQEFNLNNDIKIVEWTQVKICCKGGKCF